MAPVKSIIDLTEELIKFKTTEGNTVEFERCSRYIKDFFDGYCDVKEFSDEGVVSLLVTKDGSLSPSIMLVCHMDVVPATDAQFHPYQEADKLWGRGAIDDKGPLALAMHLVREMISMGYDASLLITGDEEKGGLRGAKSVVAKGVRPGFGIILDGGGPNTYVVKAKGILQLKLSATGSEAHGSRPWTGKNAIKLLMDDYMKLLDMFPSNDDENRWYTTVNIGRIQGGDAINKVPGFAEAWIDIRYIETADPEALVESIKAALHSDVEILSKDAPFSSDPTAEQIRGLLEVSQRVYGEQPEVIATHGGTDARHFTGTTVVVTNISGEGLHGSAECLYTDSIEKKYESLKQFIATAN